MLFLDGIIWRMFLQNLEKLFNPDCVFIVEHSIREPLTNSERFNIISDREYGETELTFMKLKG